MVVDIDAEIHKRWYATPNDLIGGWSVSNVDKPPSQHNRYSEEYELGTFMSEEIARHIVQLHNEWYNGPID